MLHEFGAAEGKHHGSLDELPEAARVYQEMVTLDQDEPQDRLEYVFVLIRLDRSGPMQFDQDDVARPKQIGRPANCAGGTDTAEYRNTANMGIGTDTRNAETVAVTADLADNRRAVIEPSGVR